MESQLNRRRWIREVLSPPEIGILYPGRLGVMDGVDASEIPAALFVDLLNRSLGGVIIRSGWRVQPDTEFHLRHHSALEEKWELSRVISRWTNPEPRIPGYHLIGVEFLTAGSPPELCDADPSGEKIGPQPEDFEFFRSNRHFQQIARDAQCAVLNRLMRTSANAGQRLIIQGHQHHACYFLQKGSCIIRCEKDSILTPIARVEAGDLVGASALLEDSPLDAHVEALTDLELWGLDRADFDSLCDVHPDLKNFLTYLLEQRFATAGHSQKRYIGKYLVTDRRGEDNTCIFFKGTHRELALPVSVTVLKHRVALEDGFRQRFQPHARTIPELNHPNILHTYKIIEGFRTVALVTEQIEGEPLGALLARWGRLPPPRSTHFIYQMCNGLHYAHERGIAHGNLQPANIMILPGDRLKIADFGLIREAERFPGKAGAEADLQSPEEERYLIQQEDIFALGLTAYHMLTGENPLQAPEPAAGDETAHFPEVPDPARTVPGLPDLLRRFVLKACASSPGSRFRSAGQAGAHLLPLVEAHGLQEPQPETGRRAVATVSLHYDDRRRENLIRLIERFNATLATMGAGVNSVKFDDP